MACAERTPPGTQEAFLAALERELEPAFFGPIEPGCRCEACRPLARLMARLEGKPRAERLREAFVSVLAEHLDLVLKTPNAYDRRLGAPRAAWGDRPDLLKETNDED